MTRYTSLWRISAVFISFLGSPAWAQGPPGSLPPQPQPEAGHLPKLAVAVAVQQSAGQDRQNVEDLLMIELGNQPFLQLVDRQALEAVMREHAIALSNQADPKDAITLGKFAGADYLLYVLVAKDKVSLQTKASVRLVEVATGQVKVDEQFVLSENLALSLAAVREKILAAVRPESQAANRLTVGIAALPNRSGTARSDPLGVELQKALRKRLNERSWAVVLEREYPKVLLDEVELGRAGLVGDRTVEDLPPADFVISGIMEDVGREYEPGKPWQVKVDLTLRLRAISSQFGLSFPSDTIEAAADELMRRIDEFRRQPMLPTNVPEKELWRRQAMYLMPKYGTWAKAIVPKFSLANEVCRRETIRAWENVLLLDANDTEAVTYLGVCLIGFNYRSTAPVRVAQAIAGSQLLERLVRNHPTEVVTDTFVASIDAMRELSPARAREMAQYVVDHPDQFKTVQTFWVKWALVMPSSKAEDSPDTITTKLKRVIENAAKDRDSVLLAFMYVRGPNKKLSDQEAAVLAQYLDSPVPVVQFLVHKTLGEHLCLDRRDPAGLGHFDKAIDLLEQAAGAHYNQIINEVYRRRIEACELLGRPDEAKQTALAGARRFMAAGQFDQAVAWLYHHCVTEVLGPGEEKEALAICDAYFPAAAKRDHEDREYSPGIAAKREEILARMAGKPVPDLGGLRLLKMPVAERTRNAYPMRKYMAATEGKLWVVGNHLGMSGAFVYSHAEDRVSELRQLPHELSCVAATTDCVFFGGMDGLYKLDTNGMLLKHYDRESGAIPGKTVADVCEGGGKIYFSFSGIIAVLDPASDTVAVLAPSSRDVKRGTEPLGATQLHWDSATPRLYAYFNQYPAYGYPKSIYFSWTPQSRAWQRYGMKEAPWVIVSQGNEALLVWIQGEKSKFEFVKSGQKVSAAVPAPWTMGEPAWDQTRIWVPTCSGLYEVDRATGNVRWVAYQEGNPFFSLLNAHGRLYVATSRGLYWCGIP